LARPYLEKPITKKGRVAQGVGLEFKPHTAKKKNVAELLQRASKEGRKGLCKPFILGEAG
jgi:hypothetical protein